MERSKVYENLDIEREYQDTFSIDDNIKPMLEWINYMEFHLNKAKKLTHDKDYNNALAEVRKTTSLGVRTMEIHGCPTRLIRNE